MLRQVSHFALRLRLLSSSQSFYPIQDPLSSPNASSSTLDFSAPRPKSSILQSIKRKALNLIWSNQESTGTILEIQQLDVWTPDYVKWSLRLFSQVLQSYSILIKLNGTNIFSLLQIIPTTNQYNVSFLNSLKFLPFHDMWYTTSLSKFPTHHFLHSTISR